MLINVIYKLKNHNIIKILKLDLGPKIFEKKISLSLLRVKNIFFIYKYLNNHNIKIIYKKKLKNLNFLAKKLSLLLVSYKK